MFWAPPSNVLADPQQVNSYNYARGNPIRFSDPEGKSIEDFRGPYGSAPYQTGDLFGSYQGVNIYNNGGNPNSYYQCTEFADRFMAANWGVNASNLQASGMDYTAPTLNAQLGSGGRQFVTSYNGQPGNTLPMEDSLITFGPTSRYPNGHVAVIGAVNFDPRTNSGYVMLAQQNAKQFNPRLSLTRTVNGSYQVANFSGMKATGWTAPANRTTSGTGGGTSNQPSQSGVLSALVGVLRQISSFLSGLR